ncbi:MAG: Ig-like domain repeat protein, partial [Endomicrobiia bacterium]|nr:Ig-like domain repeat protein [Endomicrobiia bacterium]
MDGSNWNDGYDAAGIGYIKLRVRRTNNGSSWEYWQGGGSWAGGDPGYALNVTNFDFTGSQIDRRYIWDLTPPFPMGDNYLYEIYTRAQDLSDPNKFETPVFSSMTYDSTPPTSRVIFPPIAGSAYAGALATISGTAADANTMASRVNKVDVAVKRLSDNKWWGGWSNQAWTDSSDAVFSTSTIYNIWTSSMDWRYVVSPAMWTDTTSYYVISRAQDNATNFEPGWSTNTFTCDTTPPTSRVTVPVAESMVDNLPSISGTAADLSPGLLDRVGIIIYCVAGQDTGIQNKYWSPTQSQWLDAPEMIDIVTAGPSWGWNASNVAWAAKEDPGYQYKIGVRAWDKAGNKETEVAASTITFSYAAPLPRTYVTSHADSSYYKVPGDLTVTGTGDSYTSEVWVQISSGPGYSTYWSHYQSAWVSVSTWCPAGGVSPFSYPFPNAIIQDGVRYVLRSRGKGSAGWESEGEIENIYINADRTQPSVGINNIVHLDHYTGHSGAKNIIEIKGTATDADSSMYSGKLSSVKVQLKKKGASLTYNPATHIYETGDFWLDAVADDTQFNSNNEPWTYTIAYPTSAWKDEGEYEIYARALDAALSAPGNTYTSPSREIVIDRTSPTSALLYPNLNRHNSAPVISGTASDAAPGIWRDIFIRVKNLDTTWYWTGSAWDTDDVWVSSASLAGAGFTFWPSSWQYTGVGANWASGNKYNVKFYAVDRAGNQQSPGAGLDFIFDATRPESRVTVPVGALAKLKSLDEIRGTADDSPPSGKPWATGVSTTSLAIPPYDGVNIALKSVAGDFYNGSDWTDPAHYWFTVSYSSTTKEWAKLTSVLGTFTGIGVPADGTYQIISRAIDNARNFEVAYTTKSFIWDTTPPTSFATFPSSGTFVPSLSQITGTASDITAGSKEVRVRFSYTSGSEYYWTGSSWTTNTHDLVFNAGGSVGVSTWTVSITTGLVQGTQYAVRSAAVDEAINQESDPRTIYFSCDRVGPVVSVTSPTAGAYYGPLNPLSTIRGTASDSPAGVSRTELKIINVTDNVRWNGIAWGDVAESTWVAASGTADWQAASPSWTPNRNFTAQARSYDAAGNFTEASIVSFMYDSTAPVAGLIDPDAAYESSLPKITGTAADVDPVSPGVKSGLSKVEAAILRGADYWDQNGNVFSAGEKWWDAAGTTDWQWQDGDLVWQDGVGYVVRARSIDGSSNVSSIAERSFTYDNTDAVAVTTYPVSGGKYSALPVIAGTASDPGSTPSGVKDVWVVLRNLQTNLYWNPASGLFNLPPDQPTWGKVGGTLSNWTLSSSSYTLESGVQYKIWVEARDNSGRNPADPDWATTGLSFRYDTEPPVSKATAPVEGLLTKNQVTGIFGTTNDTATGASGVKYVMFRMRRSDNAWWSGGAGWAGSDNSWFYADLTDGNPGSWWKVFDPVPFAADYSYTLWPRSEDWAVPSANMETNISSVTFVLDQTNPESSVLYPANNEWYKTLTTITGTADDILPVGSGKVRSGLSRAEVEIKRLSDDYIYQTGGFASVASSFQVVNVWTSSWTFSPANYWTNGTSYTIRARAWDSAANWAVSSENYIIYDTSAPASFVTLPSSNAVVMVTLPTISGTSRDWGPGKMKEVKVRLQRVTVADSEAGDDAWWSGSNWSGTDASWLDAAWNEGPGVWTFPMPASGFFDYNGGYRVDARAEDRAGNFEIIYASRTFIFRPPAAASVITAPTHGTFRNSLTSIAGTANSETQVILLSVQRESDNYFRAASSWTADETWLNITPSSPSWSFTPGDIFVHGSSYTLRSRGRNTYGIWENQTLMSPPAANAVRFTWDTGEPSSVIRRPASGEFYNALLTLSGTASDALAGIRSVGVQIKKGSEYFVVAESSWVAYETEATWNPANFAGGNYQLVMVSSTAAVAWSDGVEYFAKSRAIDDVYPLPGNREGAGSGNAGLYFRYDVTRPTATVSLPVTDGKYRTLTVVSGAIGDNLIAQNSVRRVQIYIQDMGPTPAGYYTGSGWQSGIVWLSTETSANFKVHQSSWEYTIGNIWTSGKKYLAVSRALDRAGNQQDIFDVGASSNTFIYDTDSPVTVVTLPSVAWRNSITKISGTAADTPAAPNNFAGITVAGGGFVKLTIYNKTIDRYWTGSNWTGVTPSTFIADAVGGLLTEWEYNISGWLSDNEYDIRAWGADDIGNEENVSVKYTVIFDTTPPLSQINYPSAASNFTSLVAVSGTANAALGGLDTVEIQVSSRPASGGSWTVMSGYNFVAVNNIWPSSWSWTTGLPSWQNAAEYRLVSRAKDRAANTDITLSTVTFIFDTAPPSLAIIMPDNNKWYSPNAGAISLSTISGTSDDLTSGATMVYIKVRNTTDAAWVLGNAATWILTAGTSPWTYQTPALTFDKRYEVYARAQDRAGNLSAATTSAFIFDASTPTATLWKPDSDYHNSLPTISGTASEVTGVPRAGLDLVQITIQRTDNSERWNAAASVWAEMEEVNAYFNATNVPYGGDYAGDGGWYSINSTTPAWENGITYIIKSRALDRAGNISPAFQRQFTYDTTRPVSKLIAPPESASSAARKELSLIAGTASDTSPGKVGAVELRIKDTDGNTYWSPGSDDFIEFGNPANAWFVALSTDAQQTAWSYAFNENKWVEGKTYSVETRARDVALNYDNTVSTSVFMWDRTPPVSGVEFPEFDKSYRILATISGTAKDLAGLAVGSGIQDASKIRIAVRKNDKATDPWWDGFSGFNSPDAGRWRNASGFESIGGSQYNWTYTHANFASALASGSSYFIQVQAFDIAFNTQTVLASCTFWFDNAEPDTLIQLPAVDSPHKFYTSLPTLSGTSSDATAGVLKVELNIRDLADDKPWLGSGSGWGSAGATNYVLSNLSSGGTFWQYADAPVWAQGRRYRVDSRATDNVIYPSGVVETSLSTRFFVVESSAPVSRLIIPSPTADTKYNTLLQLTGTAVDYPLESAGLYKSGLSKVELRIENLTDNEYYDGGAWQSGAPVGWLESTLSGTGDVRDYRYPSSAWGTAPWLSGRRYRATSRAQDILVTYQSPASSTTFIFDDTAPTSDLERPAAGASYSSSNPLSRISGTAVDHFNPNNAAVEKIQISIYRDENADNPDPGAPGAEDYWWYGSSWVAVGSGHAEKWFDHTSMWTISGGSRGFYTDAIGADDWVSGKTYRIRHRAQDYLGNTETPPKVRTFSVDNIAPASRVNFPVNNNSYINPAVISGTAADDSATSSGVSYTEIQIEDVSVGKGVQPSGLGYWDGANWVAGSSWVVTTPLTGGATKWQYTSLPANWPSDRWYRVTARARDIAGNKEEDNFTLSYIEFSVDNQPPEASLVVPADGTGYSPSKALTTLSGTAVDAFSGLDGTLVKIVMQNLRTGKYWTSAMDWTGNNYWADVITDSSTVSGKLEWKYIKGFGWQSGHRYNVVVIGRDKAGNEKTYGSSTFTVGVDSNTFTYDSSPPEFAFTRPLQGAATPVYSVLATVSGTAADKPDGAGDFNSGVKRVEIRISYLLVGDTYYWQGGGGPVYWSSETVTSFYDNTGGSTWTYTHSKFADSSAWLDGRLYRVDARAEDNSDNQSSWRRQSLIYDSVPPEAAVVNLPLNLRAYDTLSSITGTAQDAHSRVGKVQIYLQAITRGATYWNDATSQWVASGSPLWFDVGTFDEAFVNWTYNIPTPATTLTDAHGYDIEARAFDAAGSTGAASGIRRFFHDITNPSSLISPPPETDKYYKEITTVSGTSTDATAGIDGVNVAIRRLDNDQWWDNGAKAWDVNPRWITASADGSVGDKSRPWTAAVATECWTTGGTSGNGYSLRTRARDYAANATHYEGGTADGAIKVQPFYIDRAAPTFAIISPENNRRYKELSTLTGTATDSPAGVNKVEVAVRRIAPAGYWNGNNGWDGGIVWSTTSYSNPGWIYTKIHDASGWTSGAQYELYVRVLDEAGNLTPNATASFQMDWESPYSRMIEPGPGSVAYRSAALSSISGTAADVSPGTGIDQIRLRVRRSDGRWFDGLGWSGAETSWHSDQITITPGIPDDWTRTAFPGGMWEPGYSYALNARAKDRVDYPAENNLEVAFTTRTYYFDTLAPVSSVNLPSAGTVGAPVWRNTLPTISGTVNDPAQEVAYPEGASPSGAQRAEVSVYRHSDDKYFGAAGFTLDNSSFHVTALNQSTWTYAIGDSYWTTNTSYTVVSRAYDNAANLAWGTTNYFIFDTTKPVSNVTMPPGAPGIYPDVYIFSLASGAASDLFPGSMDTVEAQIKHIHQQTSAETFWTGSIWAGVTWLSASYNQTTGVWTFSAAGMTWQPDPEVDGEKYEIRARATDKAGNIQESPYTPGTMLLRPPRPRSTITTVTNNAFYTQFVSVGGTASPAASGIGETQYVNVQIERGDGKYYTNISTTTNGYWISQSTWMRVTPELPNWSFTVEGSTFAHGQSYTIRSRAVSMESVPEWNPPPFGGDDKNNPPAPNVVVTFGIDNQNPLVSVQEPSRDFYKALTTLSGTADDSPSGVNSIQIRIARPDAHFWRVSDSSWTMTEVWNTTSTWSDGEWRVALPENPWTENTTYFVRVRVYDKVIPTQNLTTASDKAFVYDVSFPTAAVTLPAADGIYSSIPQITGTARDWPSKGNIENVEVSVFANSGDDAGKYYKATPPGWTFAVTWNTAAVYALNNASWSFTAPTFQNQAQYTVTARAKDRADNQQTAYGVGVSSVNFLLDNQGPSASITFPASPAVNLGHVGGASFDFLGQITDNLAGASTTYIQLSKLIAGDTYYWTGVTWSSSAVVTLSADEPTPASFGGSPVTWSYNMNKVNMESDRDYRVRIYAFDNARPSGNQGAWTSYDFTVDTTPPLSVARFPADGSTHKNLTVISGTALGDLAGIAAVSVSLQRIAGVAGDDWYWSHFAGGGSWVNYSTSAPASVTAGKGQRDWTYSITDANFTSGTRYRAVSRARDAAGNFEVVMSTVEFIYDRTAPETAITIPALDYYGAS